MDEYQQVAVSEYLLASGRVFEPGEIVEIPIDALIFSNYQGQHIYRTFEQFKKERCIYDPETNEWLIHFVTQRLLYSDIPPVYLDIYEGGIALVDGSHRVTAHLIAGDTHILAQLNKDS